MGKPESITFTLGMDHQTIRAIAGPFLSTTVSRWMVLKMINNSNTQHLLLTLRDDPLSFR
jgi:hypothetical protein